MHRSTLSACGILSAGVFGSHSVAAQCQQTWSSGFSFPGPTHRVFALGSFDDGTGPKIIAGGFFPTAGGVTAQNIASWSSSDGWQPLGGGALGSVTDLAVYQGELYVGGDFLSVSDLPGTRAIAKWDGQAWSSVGGGVQRPGFSFLNVQALGEYNGELIVGGLFTLAGEVPVTNLAKWNGTTWSDFSPGAPNGPVTDFEEYNGQLVACGQFFTIGGVTASCIAAWNGAAWAELGGGIRGPGVFGNDLMVDDGELYVTGQFTSAGPISTNGIAKWNGLAWDSLGTGFRYGQENGTGNKLCMFNDELHVAGHFSSADGVPVSHLAKWNGASWSALPLEPGAPSGWALGPLEMHDGRLLIGGNFVPIGGAEMFLAAWDVSRFEHIGAGNGANQKVECLVSTRSGVLAAGMFEEIGDEVVDRLALWDGAGWRVLDGGVFPGAIHAGAEWRNEIYVGGFFDSIGGVPVNGIAKWSGEWLALPVPPGSGIISMVVHDDSLILAGSFAASWEYSGLRVLRWDGNAFASLGASPNASVSCLHVHHGQIVAAGDFMTIGGVSARRVAMWNGATWAPLGTGIRNSGSATPFVRSMATFENDLIVGGLFELAGDAPVSNLARWDGSHWSMYGGGADAAVTALCPHNDSLFMGGAFSSAGGVSALRAARRSGGVWSALSGFTDGTVEAITTFNSDIYFGGRFPAGPNRSSNFVRLETSGPGADLNGDHSVELSDLAILLSEFGFEDPGQFSADFDQSGTVDLSDLSILLGQFGQRCP